MAEQVFLGGKADGEALQISKTAYGTHNGAKVSRFDVRNASGMMVSLINYGATIASLRTPDSSGHTEEVTLQYDSLDQIREKSPYYGCTIGRMANRIKEGTFSLDGQRFQLAVNNGLNSLHGGIVGFDKVVWDWAVEWDETKAGVKFTYVSKDGEEGYPGTLTAHVSYCLTTSSELVIRFEATTTAPTPVNLTNHAYWNLSGDFKRKIYSHTLRMSCSRYLPLDEHSIPTGEIAPVIGTPFDFCSQSELGQRISQIPGGIDHCFVVDAQPSCDQWGCRHVATLCDLESGRVMDVRSTQPGVQVYSANFLSHDESVHPHTIHNALCLETQHFPDSVNQPNFPDVVLRPGHTYSHTTVYAFTVL